MTQAALAERMRTKQPAIARLESGVANIRLSTLAELAKALDATVRVDMDPCEFLERGPERMRWWEHLALAEQTPVGGQAINLQIHVTAVVNNHYTLYTLFEREPAVRLNVERENVELVPADESQPVGV